MNNREEEKRRYGSYCYDYLRDEDRESDIHDGER